MTLIDVKPRVFKHYALKIGADNYEKHVSGVSLVPNAPTQTWQGAHPDSSFSDVQKATWTCQLEYAQDWETANSLSRYLMEHEGEIINAVEFSPLGSGPKFTANLTITPGTIGGAIGAFGTATVTLGSSKPSFAAGTVTP